MPLDASFLESVETLHSPTMGTEVMAPLIYNLIRFTRPRRVLEIGSGYTSAFILEALSDNASSHAAESAPGGPTSPLALGHYYEEPYIPRLDCIDTLAHSRSSANRVVDFAREAGLARHLHFHHADFRGYSKELTQEEGTSISYGWTQEAGETTPRSSRNTGS